MGFLSIFPIRLTLTINIPLCAVVTERYKVNNIFEVKDMYQFVIKLKTEQTITDPGMWENET